MGVCLAAPYSFVYMCVCVCVCVCVYVHIYICIWNYCLLIVTWILCASLIYFQDVKMLDFQFSSVQSLSHVWLFATPMNRSTPGLPVHHQLPEFTQTHVHRVSDAIQPSHPLSSPSAPNPSQQEVSKYTGILWIYGIIYALLNLGAGISRRVNWTLPIWNLSIEQIIEHLQRVEYIHSSKALPWFSSYKTFLFLFLSLPSRFLEQPLFQSIPKLVSPVLSLAL